MNETTRKSKILDDVVIIAVLVLCLLISVFFLVAMVQFDQPYQPSAFSAFLGIAVAALTYRFLGGSETAEFKLGVLKITGSAALFFGITYLVGNWVQSETDRFASNEDNLQKIATLDEQLSIRKSGIVQRDARIVELEKLLADAPRSRRNSIIDQVKKLPNGDPVAQDIQAMVEGKDRPFSDVLKTIQVRIAVATMEGSEGRYRICPKVLENLAGEQTLNPRLRLQRIVPGEGDPRTVDAQRNGLITHEPSCALGIDTFDVQINCEAALALFGERNGIADADAINSCSESSKLRGKTVSLSSLAV